MARQSAASHVHLAARLPRLPLPDTHRPIHLPPLPHPPTFQLLPLLHPLSLLPLARLPQLLHLLHPRGLPLPMGQRRSACLGLTVKKLRFATSPLETRTSACFYPIFIQSFPKLLSSLYNWKSGGYGDIVDPTKCGFLYIPQCWGPGDFPNCINDIHNVAPGPLFFLNEWVF
jgi:hypothetical protein